MRTSLKLTQVMLLLLALTLMSVAALAADPGLTYPAAAEVSDQKAGSVLFYNIYSSGASNASTQNTRISITNTSSTSAAFVHLFFVDGSSCGVADSYICLTANQTATFLASDVDPGVTGYVVALAVDGVTGCPTSFNWLIGDEYVKLTTGHSANLGAEAISALYTGVLPGCDANSVTATINFDGTLAGYNRVPAVLAASSIPSRLDGNDTLLVVNRVGGNLSIGASTLGTLFGILYNDAESAFSFTLAGSCQLRTSLTDGSPRLVPRFTTIIPQGRSGWLKIQNQTGSIGILGSVFNFNANAGTQPGSFSGGRNLHKLTLTTASYVLPTFPPSC